jgi:hypothetical protein
VAKTKAIGSLADAVETAVQNQRPGYTSWFHKLPAEAQAEFLEARRRFDHTRHQKTAYARALIAEAKARGWTTAGESVLCMWLGQS